MGEIVWRDSWGDSCSEVGRSPWQRDVVAACTDLPCDSQGCAPNSLVLVHIIVPQQQQLWVHHNHTEISEVSSVLSNAAFRPGETAVDWTLKMSCMHHCCWGINLLSYPGRGKHNRDFPSSEFFYNSFSENSHCESCDCIRAVINKRRELIPFSGCDC